MTFTPKKSAAVEKPTEHHGFREDGSHWTADAPVTNACTRAVWDLVRKQREADLRPYEMALEINRQPEFVRSMFPYLNQWCTLERYWQWRLAWTGTSAASTLKHSGAGVPLSADESPWLKRLAHAQRVHAEPDTEHPPFDLSAFLPDPPEVQP